MDCATNFMVAHRTRARRRMRWCNSVRDRRWRNNWWVQLLVQPSGSGQSAAFWLRQGRRGSSRRRARTICSDPAKRCCAERSGHSTTGPSITCGRTCATIILILPLLRATCRPHELLGACLERLRHVSRPEPEQRFSRPDAGRPKSYQWLCEELLRWSATQANR